MFKATISYKEIGDGGAVGDIEADEDEGVDGFVATPGGRLWYVDTKDMIVRQLCSLNCLPQDPLQK